MARQHEKGLRSIVGLPDDQQLTITDVSGVLNISYASAYELVVGGQITHQRHGKKAIRILVSDLREYISHNRIPARLPQRRPADFVNIKKGVERASCSGRRRRKRKAA